ncbi:MAG TPA: cell division protein, partial [Gammaproteobacteria bacterium]|nr:cell division protein [Gammaproteobacteria bacterium]
MIVSQLNTYLLRHLQAAISTLGQLWRQPLASLMTATTIAIALSLPASLTVLLYNMHSVTEHWQ